MQTDCCLDWMQFNLPLSDISMPLNLAWGDATNYYKSLKRHKSQHGCRVSGSAYQKCNWHPSSEVWHGTLI